MKKSALTAGAITLLGQGIGLAAEAGTSSFLMKCTHPAPDSGQSGTKTFGLQSDGTYDSDPTGYVNHGTAETPQWEKIFVQAVIVSDIVADSGWFSSYTATLICKGRWILVAADNDHDTTVIAPSDNAEWSEWTIWPRIVDIDCASSNGKITRSKNDNDAEQDGDTFDDGSHIETSLIVGEGGTQTCTVTYKAPWGSAGDTVTAELIFKAENRT